MNTNRAWWTLIAAFICLALPASRIAEGAQPDPHETAIDELFWAIHACEEGMQPETAALRKQQLLEDYRFRRTRALRVDASVQSLPRIRQYATRDWLRRCDTVFPKLAEQGKRQAAAAEASSALVSCAAAITRGTTDQAETDFQTFKAKKTNAFKLDPSIEKTKLGQELVACDKQVNEFIQARKRVEAEAVRRYREDATKPAATATREKESAVSMAAGAPKPSPAIARPALAQAQMKR